MFSVKFYSMGQWPKHIDGDARGWKKLVCGWITKCTGSGRTDVKGEGTGRMGMKSCPRADQATCITIGHNLYYTSPYGLIMKKWQNNKCNYYNFYSSEFHIVNEQLPCLWPVHVSSTINRTSTHIIWCFKPAAAPQHQCQHHTHTHPFNSPFCGTAQVSRYQSGKTNLDFTEARDSERQWHQLGCMQVCTSLQTDNHASTPPLSFSKASSPSCHPTNSIKALKFAQQTTIIIFIWCISQTQ